jgi:hypothetical protein
VKLPLFSKTQNFRNLDKGRVRTHKKFPQATVEQGEEKTRNFRSLQWSRVRIPQATHRQGEGKTGHFLRLHTGRVRAKQEFPQATHRQGEGKSGQFARYSQAGCELPSGCSQAGCKPSRERRK